MFFEKMRRSHRLRLSSIATFATAAILAIAFACILYWARADRVSVKRAELQAVMAMLFDDSTGAINFEEAAESHPGISVQITNGASESGFEKRKHELVLRRSAGGKTVSLTTDWRESEASLRTLAFVFVLLWVPLSLLSGFVTWSASNAVFRPLGDIVDQARRIDGESQTVRLATRDLAEFRELVDQLNVMLDRVHAAARREERFAQDAAHELRTPLAIMRTQVETLMLKTRTIEEHEQANAVVLSEIERMIRLSEFLLDSTRKPGPAPEIDVSAAVTDAAKDWSERYPGRVRIDLEPSAALITPTEVEIVVSNLVSNALCEADHVTISLAGRNLRFDDDGPGFPEEFVDIAFDRLSRPDAARRRSDGGHGLGLAIVHRIVTRRGGSVRIERSPMGGAAVVVTLPS